MTPSQPATGCYYCGKPIVGTLGLCAEHRAERRREQMRQNSAAYRQRRTTSVFSPEFLEHLDGAHDDISACRGILTEEVQDALDALPDTELLLDVITNLDEWLVGAQGHLLEMIREATGRQL